MKELNCRFAVSASVDGLILDKEFRSFKDESLNSKRDKVFYEKVINFIKKYPGGFHPMVSAKSAKYWKENLKWWMDILGDYNRIMTLEVRNDDWENKDIQEYLDFLNFKIDNNIEFLGRDIFINDILLNKNPKYNCYYPERLSFKNLKTPSCTISKLLCIRLGDLAIAPCHRLSYDEYLYGHFLVENNKIIGIKSKNVVLANKILLGNFKHTVECGTCPFADMCVKGCLGAQYEINQDPFITCKSVCELYKAKICFLIYKYEKLNILSELSIPNTLINDIKNTKEYQAWKPFITNLIK